MCYSISKRESLDHFLKGLDVTTTRTTGIRDIPCTAVRYQIAIDAAIENAALNRDVQIAIKHAAMEPEEETFTLQVPRANMQKPVAINAALIFQEQQVEQHDLSVEEYTLSISREELRYTPPRLRAARILEYTGF